MWSIYISFEKSIVYHINRAPAITWRQRTQIHRKDGPAIHLYANDELYLYYICGLAIKDFNTYKMLRFLNSDEILDKCFDEAQNDKLQF